MAARTIQDLTPIIPRPDPNHSESLSSLLGISLADGKIVTVTGRFENGLLIIETVDPELFMGNAPDLILVEGFLSEPDERDEVSLNGVAVAAANPGDAIDPATQVRRCALRGRLDFALSDLPASELATIESFCATVLPRE